MKLKEICEYISDRVAVTAVSKENYISTENMAQNKGGVTRSSSIPSSGAVIRYTTDDILISNIRPYFKKIWQADKTGGCSADVLCIRAKNHIDSTFLYYLLSQDAFFEYVMTGAKGCKMPRGDKGHIMDWEIDIILIQCIKWEKEMGTHSSILAWRGTWTEEPGGPQSTGSQSQTRLSDKH